MLQSSNEIFWLTVAKTLGQTNVSQNADWKWWSDLRGSMVSAPSSKLIPLFFAWNWYWRIVWSRESESLPPERHTNTRSPSLEERFHNGFNLGHNILLVLSKSNKMAETNSVCYVFSCFSFINRGCLLNQMISKKISKELLWASASFCCAEHFQAQQASSVPTFPSSGRTCVVFFRSFSNCLTVGPE